MSHVTAAMTHFLGYVIEPPLTPLSVLRCTCAGTPVYLFGLGDGIDFKGDANDVYTFRCA